jgi:hypothetical protein
MWKEEQHPKPRRPRTTLPFCSACSNPKKAKRLLAHAHKSARAARYGMARIMQRFAPQSGALRRLVSGFWF